MPGKLSVSRAFGNIEAKTPLFNGNPNVVIAKPDIKYFDINPNYDFIVIGCDGIFEYLKNKDLIEIIWKNAYKETSDIHNKCGVLVESVISECINKKSSDNLSLVLISFKDKLKRENFNNEIYGLKTQQVDKQSKFNKLNYNDSNSQIFKLNINENPKEERDQTLTPKIKDVFSENIEFNNFNTNKEINYNINYLNKNNGEIEHKNKLLLETFFKNNETQNIEKLKHKFITINEKNKKII